MVSNRQLDIALEQELQRMDRRIMKQALREAEKNFEMTIKGFIEMSKWLEQDARKQDDQVAAAHHSLKRQICQQFIDKYE